MLMTIGKAMIMLPIIAYLITQEKFRLKTMWQIDAYPIIYTFVSYTMGMVRRDIFYILEGL